MPAKGTRKNRLSKAASTKEVKRMIQGQFAEGEEIVEEFITGQDAELRLAQIVKYEGDKRYKIKFSEHGKEMLGEYRPKRSRNLSRKAKTAGKQLNRNALPGEGSFILVRWDAAQAENNKARGQEGIANIAAVLPKRAKLEEMAMKAANQAAKRAGESKPWPVDDLFEREEEEEEESKKPEAKSKAKRNSNNASE